MTGPEHYREAERLLGTIPTAQEHAKHTNASAENLIAVMAQIAAEAQVHATLALAAATAAGQATAYDGDETNARSRGWAGVA